jgi:hypothetical protein
MMAGRRTRLRTGWLGVAIAILLVGALAVGTRIKDDRAQSDVRRSPVPQASSVPTHLTTDEGPPIPRRGAYLGAWVHPQPDNPSGRVASVKRFERLIGQPLDVVHLYRKFGQPIGTESDLAFARSGKYLMLSWSGSDLREVATGRQDAMIAKAAAEIAALPTKVFLAFRTEMNRPNLRSVVHSPQDFVAAWDHVYAIFAAHRVANVAWTWCPTAAGFDDATAPAYYPGDGKVDWICADIYPKTPWRNGDNEAFSTLADAFVKWSAHHPKPIIIGEMGVGRSYGSRRGPWITDAGRYIEAHQQIKAIMWFDQELPNDPDFYRYALEGDPPAVRAFANFVQDGYFGNR